MEEQYFIICLPIISLTENVWEAVINFQLFYAGFYDSPAKTLECCLVNMAPEMSQRKKAQSVERVSFTKRQWFRHKQKCLNRSWKRHNANGKLIIEAEDPFQSNNHNNGGTLFQPKRFFSTLLMHVGVFIENDKNVAQMTIKKKLFVSKPTINS